MSKSFVQAVCNFKSSLQQKRKIFPQEIKPISAWRDLTLVLSTVTASDLLFSNELALAPG